MPEAEEIRNMSKKSTKLEALHDLFEENNIRVNLIEGNDALIEAVKKMRKPFQTTGIRLMSGIRWPALS